MRDREDDCTGAGASRRFGFWMALVPVAVAILCAAGARPSRAGASPRGFGSALPALRVSDAVILAPVDESRYLREDEERLAAGTSAPFRFAAPIATDLSTTTDGSWLRLPDGSSLWRCEVVSIGARSLNFGFTTCRLPEGATLYLYPADRQSYLGPYTARDVTPEGEFWTPVIRGDDAVIELFIPARPAFEPELRISQVAHDYRGFLEMKRALERSGACNNDVVCPEGAPWSDQINSVGEYTIQGTWVCSGQMINSLTLNPPPYFLTANHCGVNPTNVPSIVVYWNFQSPNCGDHGGGSLDQHQAGATITSRYLASDFLLLQLNQDPPDSSHVFYTGWNADPANAPASAVCIHHPSHDEKSISFDTDPLTVTSWASYSVPGDGTHWRVDNWESGTTETGSSGSGLWDPGHHLVGQLHGGYASCTSLLSDWFGRFSVSWIGGGTPASRLRDWLDPTSTGALVAEGRYRPDPAAVEPAQPGSARSATTISNILIQPNPAHGRSQISFELPRAARVRFECFDAAGRSVLSRPAQSFPAGRSAIPFDPVGLDGAHLPPGLYFVRMEADGLAAGAHKLILVQ